MRLNLGEIERSHPELGLRTRPKWSQRSLASGLTKAPLDENPKISGGDIEEVTPDPIPNSEVKLFGADGTAREAVWESRKPPGLF